MLGLTRFEYTHRQKDLLNKILCYLTIPYCILKYHDDKDSMYFETEGR